MTEIGQVQIPLNLRAIDELFEAPHLDPLNGQFHEMSGVEQLVAELLPRSIVRSVQITIHLPADRLSEDIEGRCTTALRGYCAARIRQIDREKDHVNRQGRRELELGLLFLAVCLLGAGWVEVMDWLPNFLGHVLGEGLVIVGWIALWHPVDLLLFERWSLIRERRCYEAMRDAELHVLAID